jgi:hypothetical protein
VATIGKRRTRLYSFVKRQEAMDDIFKHLANIAGVLQEDWPFFLALAVFLLIAWFRNVTSPLPSRRAGIGR